MIQGDVVGVFCRHLKNYIDRVITVAVKLRVSGQVLNEAPSPDVRPLLTSRCVLS